MIKRDAEQTIRELAKCFPVVALTGPRQSGKTTLARSVFPQKTYITLEAPDTLEIAEKDPRGFLAGFPDGAIIDEIQRSPALFSYLQSIVDLDGRTGLYVLTGSQQFGLLSRISQSLAGRVGLVQLLPFSYRELVRDEENKGASSFVNINLDELLYKGLYPPIYDRNILPEIWFSNYVLTYIERDVRQILNVKDLSVFQRFVRMCAARNGQMLNLSSLANDCGITHNTAQAWINVLEASYVIHLLRPHYRNFGKRLVKTPKLYFYDTGLAAWLLNIQDAKHLGVHPSKGSLFEGFILGEMLKNRFNHGLASNLFYWRNNLGDEIDLLEEKGEVLFPIEIKAGQTLNSDFFKELKKWQKIAGEFSGNARLIYGGEQSSLCQGITVSSWKDITLPSIG